MAEPVRVELVNRRWKKIGERKAKSHLYFNIGPSNVEVNLPGIEEHALFPRDTVMVLPTQITVRPVKGSATIIVTSYNA